MSFSFAPHWTTLFSSAAPSAPLHALLDVAQLMDTRLPPLAGIPLFADTFAAPAIALSPRLIAIPQQSDPAAKSIVATLDRLCSDNPALSIVCSPLNADALCLHLREFLRVETPSQDFLFRYYDPQMLGACLTCLTPAQRRALLKPIRHWWTVDHDGVLRDHVPTLTEDLSENDPCPLKLDDDQIATLLEASFPVALACQLRALEPEFETLLGKAEQARFVAQALRDAQDQGTQSDQMRTEFCFERWRAYLDALSTDQAT